MQTWPIFSIDPISLK
uniref:Uncharacterized protein n=1 Tax=Arundo donax TaxID=35708 RepID=A0A0A9CL73_ARUDO